ncbi:hypothetical protein [Pelagibaculum spongiae]|uniref:Uncharacterized protein n=1 Tax=Pelagibaculum spongiae TaxID=2080658 RepID=A0A2V1GVL7_9GAMM|nr:hypothetical protein [Pelagibaculum spongiae]PVZ68993.1 hypothetical protein DC094_12170 [Pelagibaculum spongiae]
MPLLKSNLAIAKIACVNAHSSINQLTTDLTKVSYTSDRIKQEIKLEKIRDLSFDFRSQIARKPNTSRLAAICYEKMFLSKLAIACKIGGSNELSSHAFEFLAKRRLFPIELSFAHYPLKGIIYHWFCILDRDKYSDLQNPESWGANAIICDPLTRLVLPATEYEEKYQPILEQSEATSLGVEIRIDSTQDLDGFNWSYDQSHEAQQILSDLDDLD